MRAEPRLGRIERIKMALRRDWEQTKADLFVGSGRRLKQTWRDTLRQMFGIGPVPPISMSMDKLATARGFDAWMARLMDQATAAVEARKAKICVRRNYFHHHKQ